MKKVLKFILGGFILLIVIAAIAGGSKSHTATPITVAAAAPPAQVVPPATSDATSSDLAQPTTAPMRTPAPKPKPKPAPKPAPAPAPAPAQPTAGEQNALESAQNYLSDGQGFSREGLLEQLTSSSGEGFSQSDATYAVDHAGADWNRQAVESAKNYLSDGQGFSKSDLIQQLTSSSGEGFTLAQAQYAVSVVYR